MALSGSYLSTMGLSVLSNPSQKGLFSFPQMKEIPYMCGLFESSLTYRPPVFLGFNDLFRI